MADEDSELADGVPTTVCSPYDLDAWAAGCGTPTEGGEGVVAATTYAAYDAWDDNSTTTVGGGQGAVDTQGINHVAEGDRVVDIAFQDWLRAIQHRNWSREFACILRMEGRTPRERMAKAAGVYVCVIQARFIACAFNDLPCRSQVPACGGVHTSVRTNCASGGRGHGVASCRSQGASSFDVAGRCWWGKVPIRCESVSLALVVRRVGWASKHVWLQPTCSSSLRETRSACTVVMKLRASLPGMNSVR